MQKRIRTSAHTARLIRSASSRGRYKNTGCSTTSDEKQVALEIYLVKKMQ